METESRIWGYGSAFSQIWRENLGGSVPFYPLWYNQFLNRKLPVIIDTNNLMLVVKSIPLLEAIITKKALMAKNVRFRMYKVDANGEADKTNEIFKHRTLSLLKKPNCLQSKADFIAQWSFFRSVYSDGLVYKNKPTKVSYPKILWNLPMGEMKIIPTGKLFQQVSVDEIIDYYEHINNQFPNASPKSYYPSEIIRYVENSMDQYFFGTSKLLINKTIISNIQMAFNTRNILLHDRGAIGILSASSGDDAGALPLDEEERELIQKDYHRKYGLRDDQMSVLITNSALKWQSMSYPTKDLMLFEEIEDDFCHLLTMFGLLRDIFPNSAISRSSTPIGGDGKGKIEEAMKITYSTTLQAEMDEFCDGINSDTDFNHEAEGVLLCADYTHLPCMQEDQVDAENVKNVKAQAAATMTTAIIALIGQVNSGGIQLDAALVIMEKIFGIEEDIAKEIILEPKEIIPPADPNQEETEAEPKANQTKTKKVGKKTTKTKKGQNNFKFTL